ncbi:MAG: HAD-IIB family hydrolase [Myxococcota bacterium]
MLAISGFSTVEACQTRALLTDIDDTLTTEGKLDAGAYDALWRLRQAGILVVAVTGRPAGWCDLIARQWPVDGVIGENGALAFYEEKGRMRRLYHPEAAESDARQRLAEIRAEVLEKIPGSRVATDQPYRMFDLAIDFCEEEPDLGLEAAWAIKDIFEKHGAQAKVSSIHVNGWFGSYDKLAMMHILARERWQQEPAQTQQTSMYCGDSPNDEPMFGFFPVSCAVANIAPFVSSMTQLPRYVSAKAGGEGFAEIVETLLAKRLQRADPR